MRLAAFCLSLALGCLLACDRPAASPPLTASPAAPAQVWGARVALGDDAALEETSAPLFYAGPPDGKLHLYVLDLAGAPSVLVQGPSGKTVLIDGGRTATGARLLRRLSELLRRRPDMVLLTSPTDERAGGLLSVVRSLGCQEFWDTGVAGVDGNYHELLKLLRGRSIPLRVPEVDLASPERRVHVDLGTGARLEVLWPREPFQPLLPAPAGDDANGLVLRIDYGRTSALLMGSTSEALQQTLLAQGPDLHATLLLLSSHEGAGTVAERFLEEVRPQVILQAAGRSRSAPDGDVEVRARAADAGTPVFRAEQRGELHVVGDGDSFRLTTERPGPGEDAGQVHRYLGTGEPYVSARGSRVFHRAGCPAVAQLSPPDELRFKSRARATRHHRPALDCRP